MFTVTDMRIDNLPPEHPEFKAQLTFSGNGFIESTMPLVALVGNQYVERLIAVDPQTTYFGFLVSVPAQGDKLMVGYGLENLVDTGFTVPAAQPPIT